MAFRRQQQQYPYEPDTTPEREREHGGFSNYAGGGARDLEREREREREYFAREHNPYGGRVNASWYGGREYERGRGYDHGEPRQSFGSATFDRERMLHHRYDYGGEQGWSPAERHPPPPPPTPELRGVVHGYGGDDDDRGPHYGKGPKGYKRSDERIREDLCESIARQGYVDASDVEVIVENSVVRLVGTVPLRQDKRALEHMADRVYGVEEVRNELRLQQSRQPQQQEERPQQLQTQEEPPPRSSQAAPQQQQQAPPPPQSTRQNGNARS